jgi:hypothetical protein
MAIKYINIFQSKALQIIPKLGFLVCNQTIWQPCSKESFQTKRQFRRQIFVVALPLNSFYCVHSVIMLDLGAHFVLFLELRSMRQTWLSSILHPCQNDKQFGCTCSTKPIEARGYQFTITSVKSCIKKLDHKVKNPPNSSAGLKNFDQLIIVSNLRHTKKCLSVIGQIWRRREVSLKPCRQLLRQNVDGLIADRQNVDFQIVHILVYIHTSTSFNNVP